MKNTQQELREMLKGYVSTLDAVINGDEEFFDDYGIDDDDREEYGDAYSRLSKYFEDVLEVEYRIDAQRRYKGAIIALALGGANIYLDTAAGELRGYWGGVKATLDISRKAVNRIATFFEELWEGVRDY